MPFTILRDHFAKSLANDSAGEADPLAFVILNEVKNDKLYLVREHLLA